MWKFKATTLLFRFSSRLAPSLRNVVPLKAVTVTRFSSPHFSYWVSKTKPLYQSPRFFSLDSSSNGPDSTEEIHDSSDASSSTNTDGVLHEETDFVSQESEEIFKNAADKEAVQGEIPDGGDEMSSSVSEESVEEIKAEIPEINLEQLENVVSILQSTLEEPLESTLEEMDLTVNEEFVIRVLQTPQIVGENLIGFFQWAWKRSEFSIGTGVVDTLVRVVSAGVRKKDAYALWDLVKEIGEKENAVLSTDILNELIHLFRKLGKGKAALEVFKKFGEFGCDPNAESYYFTIEALCCRSFYDWAWPVCEEMLNTGKLPDCDKLGKIICWFCKGNRAKDAHLVYLMEKEKNKYPPRSSVSFLISCLCREDATVQLAAEMLNDFAKETRKYAIKHFSSVVRGLCRMKDVKAAKDLLFKMIDEGPPPSSPVFNFVITALSKAGEMEEAMKLLEVMKGRGLRPDVYTYSVIMSGYAQGGHMEEACKVLSEAKQNHSKLTPVTYHILIRGYCKLEEFDKALKLLSEMKDFGVKPTVDEYNKLIQSLCLTSLDWKTSEKLLEEMKKDGLFLSGITRGLIGATKELVEEELQAGEVGANA